MWAGLPAQPHLSHRARVKSHHSRSTFVRLAAAPDTSGSIPLLTRSRTLPSSQPTQRDGKSPAWEIAHLYGTVLPARASIRAAMSFFLRQAHLGSAVLHPPHRTLLQYAASARSPLAAQHTAPGFLPSTGSLPRLAAAGDSG